MNRAHAKISWARSALRGRRGTSIGGEPDGAPVKTMLSAMESDNSSASEAARERLLSISLPLAPNEITSLAAVEGRWSSWVKRTGECSLCDSEARGHWADASSLVTGCSNLLLRCSLGGRRREGTRGGVAFWEESYSWAQRCKTETLTVRAISPAERSIRSNPAAWGISTADPGVSKESAK